MKEKKWVFTRLDGTMNLNKRKAALDAFRTAEDVKILLMSLKAGGLGLNLTEARYVFLLDPWWNPAVEDQAIDRVHRFGQKQDVFVSRFTIKDTVEQRILELQEKKRKLADSALGSKGSIRTKLTLQDLIELFS